LRLESHKRKHPRDRSKPLKHQSRRQSLSSQSPRLRKSLSSSSLKMMKKMVLMEESYPRLHHMMKLLKMMCHLLQWGGL
jgi:hypothetical protein